MGDTAPSNSNEPTVAGEHRMLPIPTTFGGVAALGLSPLRWLVCWQVLLALGSALAIAWSLGASFGRDLRRAADSLPDDGRIHMGRLQWPGRPPEVLVQGPFLGILANPAAARDVGLTSDVVVVLESDRFAVRSLAGWLEVPYPPAMDLSLARVDMSGALAAWTQPALIVTGVAVFFGLLSIWWLLGFLYGTVLWALAAASGRMPDLGTAWRIACAALLLPAVLMTSAIVLYATRELGLLGLLAAVPIHVVAGWVYCLGALARLPRPVTNPFRPEPACPVEEASEPANPFAPR